MSLVLLALAFALIVLVDTLQRRANRARRMA
jgi:hypothetical protein